MADSPHKASCACVQAEVWKPIPEWEGIYEVSSAGRVRSLDRIIACPNNQGIMSTRFVAGKMLSPKLTQFGYNTVALCRDGGMRHHFVHRLVCFGFIGPRPDGHEVAHSNAVRTDNRRCNLRWATKKENGADKVRHGNSLQGSRHTEAKLTEEAAIEILATRGMKRSGNRTRAICQKYGISVANFYRVRGNPKSWAHLKR